MIGQPAIDERPERPYVALRSRVQMDDLPRVIPASLETLFGWMAREGLGLQSAPVVRYRRFNSDGTLDVDVALPIDAHREVTPPLVRDALPAGRYAALVYRGRYQGLHEAHRALLDWCAASGQLTDSQSTPEGRAFAAQCEAYWTNPADEPDEAKHETEVSIKLAVQ